MCGVGWSAAELDTLQALLFDKSDAWRRDGCSMEQVTWPDVQHVFRTALCRAKGLVVKYWSEADDEMYPVLNSRNRLRFKIEKSKIDDQVKVRPCGISEQPKPIWKKAPPGLQSGQNAAVCEVQRSGRTARDRAGCCRKGPYYASQPRPPPEARVAAPWPSRRHDSAVSSDER